MKNSTLPVVLGGALASALLAIGFIGLAHKFDPVLQRAEAAITFQVVSNNLPYPGPTRHGVVNRPAGVVASNNLPYPGPTRHGVVTRPASVVASNNLPYPGPTRHGPALVAVS